MFWKNLTKRIPVVSVESALYDILKNRLLLTVFGRFFMNPDWIQIFWPIWIRTQEKNSDPDPDKRTGSETMVKLDSQIIIFFLFQIEHFKSEIYTNCAKCQPLEV